MKIIGARTLASAIGMIRIEASPEGITRVEILPSNSTTPPNTDKRMAAEAETGEAHPAVAKHLAAAEASLSEYFERPSMVPDLPLDITGTDFQRAVWEQIRGLKIGESTTYAEIAARIKNPKAVRAVGGAVGSNPVPLLIGCHRVLGSGGRITGYSGGDGLVTKRLLLNLEQIEFRE